VATRGWESVSPTELARRTAREHVTPAGHQKYRAQPCIVTADGTVFTAEQIALAESASHDPLIGTGTLRERAARVGIVGDWFASIKEAKRYIELRAAVKAGLILDLRCQVPFDLSVVSRLDRQEHTIGKWIADFVYRRADEIALTTEDTKGCKTPLYLRSKKHFQAQYGLTIVET